VMAWVEGATTGKTTAARRSKTKMGTRPGGKQDYLVWNAKNWEEGVKVRFDEKERNRSIYTFAKRGQMRVRKREVEGKETPEGEKDLSGLAPDV